MPTIDIASYIANVTKYKCMHGMKISLKNTAYYRKRGKINWAKLSRFSWFSGVPRKFFCECKCLSLIILNNEYLCTAYGQGNVKIFPQKL